jgi:apolipoprotein N-acyltransferase
MRWRVAVSTISIIAVIAAWGEMRLRSSSLLRSGTPVRVAVLQGNVPQDEKWTPANREAIMSRYLSMSREALGQGATFIMWPESATPLPFEQDILGGAAIRRMAMESKATFLIGSDQVEPIKPAAPGQKAEARYYNAAFLVKSDGTVGAVYRKMHLVPFGEYVPLQSLLYFVGPIIGAVILGTIQQLATVTISSALNLLIVGVLLILFVIIAPNGIMGLISARQRRRAAIIEAAVQQRQAAA